MTTQSQVAQPTSCDEVCDRMSKTKIGSALVSTSGAASKAKAFPEKGKTVPMTKKDKEQARLFASHLNLLCPSEGQKELDDAVNTPIFTMGVYDHMNTRLEKGSDVPITQYGLLAGVSEELAHLKNGIPTLPEPGLDPRLFFNVTSPSSTFICGSQGSGKSHTLSCLLENTLIPTDVTKLQHPLTGLLFHYDTFISDDGGSPCEAAFLSSNKGIKVRVLCAPTNVATIEKAYHQMKNITIEPLRINETDLNTKRMFDLMAVSSTDGPQPLYIQTVYRILRDMRLRQQETGGSFNYALFKKHIKDAYLTPPQMGPLQQRLDTLESFMPQSQTGTQPTKGKKAKQTSGNDWTPKAGSLTIVDLSCPCVTPEGACALFNICLSIFLENHTGIGRVVALDEAHKYMNSSAEATALTETLLATVRLQRHLGARIIISTQEPTISPKLLDLSSVTIVHRFTSPEWLRTLEGHLAGAASKLLKVDEDDEDANSQSNAAKKVFSEVVQLRVGEALLFSPSAVIGLEDDEKNGQRLKRLGTGYLKIRIRSRLTTDGGKSVMAT